MSSLTPGLTEYGAYEADFARIDERLCGEPLPQECRSLLSALTSDPDQTTYSLHH